MPDTTGSEDNDQAGSDDESSAYDIFDDDGTPVAYRPGELIAFGGDALDYLRDDLGDLGDLEVADEVEAPLVAGHAGDDMTRSLVIGFEVPVIEVVAMMEAAGYRAQVNHVLFAHADPCCGSHPSSHPFRDGADFALPRQGDIRLVASGEATSVAAPTPQLDSLSLNPGRANAGGSDKPWIFNPGRANPGRANPGRANRLVSTATPAPPPSGAEDVAQQELDDSVLIEIFDSGLGVEAEKSTWLAQRGVQGQATDRSDVLPLPRGDGLIDPVAGHGTFIAGIYRQVVPECSITVHSIMNRYGQVSEWTAAKVIRRRMHAHEDLSRVVMNMSFGGRFMVPKSLLKETIAAAQARGAVVVASAGNAASCVPQYPAAWPGVVAVGAMGSNGPASFTNYGSWVTACADGVSIHSTFLEVNGKQPNNNPLLADPDDFSQGWAVWSGTSFAAPIVGAAIAQKLVGSRGMSARAARHQVLSDPANPLVRCLGVYVSPP